MYNSTWIHTRARAITSPKGEVVLKQGMFSPQSCCAKIFFSHVSFSWHLCQPISSAACQVLMWTLQKVWWWNQISYIWNVTISHAGAGCQRLRNSSHIEEAACCLPNVGKIWSNSVALQFLPRHFAQHAIFSPAWFCSLHAALFRVLSQMLVAGTATLVCWTAAAPIKTHSWWAECSVAATVDAAGLMAQRQRCAPSQEQVGGLVWF